MRARNICKAEQNVPLNSVVLFTCFCKTPTSEALHPQVMGYSYPYLWLVGSGRMVVIVVKIVPHSSIPN